MVFNHWHCEVDVIFDVSLVQWYSTDTQIISLPCVMYGNDTTPSKRAECLKLHLYRYKGSFEKKYGEMGIIYEKNEVRREQTWKQQNKF